MRGAHKIDEVTDDAGNVIPIYYRPHHRNLITGRDDGPAFIARWNETDHLATDIIDLRAAAMTYLEESRALEWQDVIHIRLPMEYRDDGPAFGYALERYQVSKKPVGGRFIKRAKAGAPSETFYDWRASSPFSPPCDDHNSIWLPFSREAWRSLKRMQTQIRRLRRNFVQVIASEQGKQLLEQWDRLYLKPGLMAIAPPEDTDG